MAFPSSRTSLGRTNEPGRLVPCSFGSYTGPARRSGKVPRTLEAKPGSRLDRVGRSMSISPVRVGVGVGVGVMWEGRMGGWWARVAWLGERVLLKVLLVLLLVHDKHVSVEPVLSVLLPSAF